ncbi:hypothetical protein ACQKP7_20865, partial [Pseudomonas frederiksbergensis]|uniref:hypothetical protein n=1 Tax=Pseudomonas frederiksbergensis TaxID=104087 RepID=UPI003D06F492
ESGGSVSIDVGCAGLFAGKPRSYRGSGLGAVIGFSTDEKKPAEAGFSQDHVDSLSAANPCLWSIIRDPEHSLCFS